jgi:hypothetical protein
LDQGCSDYPPFDGTLTQRCVGSGFCPGLVNVVTDCHVPNDGATNACIALQNCINQNPGAHIYLPKTHSGASAPSNPITDYVMGNADGTGGCTITLKGDGMWLSGESPSRWSNVGTTIQFMNQSVGPGVLIPHDCQGCKVSDLLLNAQGPTGAGWGTCWDPTDKDLGDYDLNTYNLPEPINMYYNGTAYPPFYGTRPYSGCGLDGLMATGPEPTIERVTATCFPRHGFSLIGDGTAEVCSVDGSGQPSYCGDESPMGWSMADNFANGNQGYGLMIVGLGAGAGKSLRQMSQLNELGGIFDGASAALDTHDEPVTETDNYQGGVKTDGGTLNVLSISPTATTNSWGWPPEICTLQASGSLASIGVVSQGWVTVMNTFATGSTIGPQDGSFRVIGIGGTGNDTITYQCISDAYYNSATCTSKVCATVRTAHSQEVFAPPPSGFFPACSSITVPPCPPWTNGYPAPNALVALITDPSSLLDNSVWPQVGAFACNEYYREACVAEFNAPVCGDQVGPPWFGNGGLVIAPGICVSTVQPGSGPVSTQNWWTVTSHLLQGQGWLFDEQVDAQNIVSINAGLTADQPAGFQFFGMDLTVDPGSGQGYWALEKDKYNDLILQDFSPSGASLEMDNVKGTNPLSTSAPGNITLMQGTTTTGVPSPPVLTLGNGRSGSGPVQIWGSPTAGTEIMGVSPGGAAIVTATVSQSGQIVAPGGACTSATYDTHGNVTGPGACWFTGSTDPTLSSPLCGSTANLGSFYTCGSTTTGNCTHFLWVCTWQNGNYYWQGY